MQIAEEKPKKPKKPPHAIKQENVPHGWIERIAKGEMFLRNGRFYCNENELDKYYDKKKLTQEQFESGNRYRNDFYMGSIELISKMNLSGTRTGNSTISDLMASKIGAAEKYREARIGLIKIHQDVLDDICCMGKTIAEFERGYCGIRSDSGMQVLKHALDYLTMFYTGGKKRWEDF